MAGPWHSDDDLLASLREALRAMPTVPPDVVETGRATYTWHTIDAELAAVTYDSAHAGPAAPVTRAEAAPLRSLTFASACVSIELELAPDALLGQIAPPQVGSVVALVPTGRAAGAEIDETGYFELRPMPTAPFRLRCRTRSGAEVLTGWVTP